MKVKLPIALIILAIVCAYLMGTESGRKQRDVILVKLGRSEGDDLEDLADAVADEVEEVAEALADANPVS